MSANYSSNNWRLRFVVLLLIASSISSGLLLIGSPRIAPPVPTQLTDEEFWKLSSSMSEIDGVFQSDNLVSNETQMQFVIPELLQTAKQGRVYMGVGPEQNFTYIAALKPTMAFIIDIRHGNLDVHLMYKALFELSANRSEFVSKLFSRKPMTGFTPQTTARELATAYSSAEPSQELFDATLKAIVSNLKTKHGFPLSDGDVDGIQWALGSYFRFGPDISYNSTNKVEAPAIVGADPRQGRGGRGGGGGATYASLMMVDDNMGKERNYLANDENFMYLKNLESKNLLVPVVGDFGGSKAIREVGKYIKSVDGMVSAFYLSNVEQYLQMDGKMPAFLANVAALPIDPSSRFIRSGAGGGGGGGRGGGRGGVNFSSLGNMVEESQPYAGR
jgi:hypothetical protein